MMYPPDSEIPGMVPPSRPHISILNSVLCHNYSYTKFVISKNLISVGCTDITPEAAKFILTKWEEKFGKPEQKEIVIQ